MRAHIADPKSIVSAAILLISSLWFAHPLFLLHTYGNALPALTTHNLLFDSHEKLHYIIRLAEFDDALRTGQLFPRWCNNLCGGYGYPFFNFYAPLAYYLTEPFLLLTANLFAAWKLQFIALAFLGSLGTYAYARLFTGRVAATMAALLFQFAPYHIANLYVRGNVAEFTAMSLLPWLFWAMHSLIRKPRSIAFLCTFVVMLAAVILSHNVTALFTCGFLVLYVGTITARTHDLRPAATAVVAIIAALVLTAFFWAPALYEMRYCQPGEMQESFLQTTTHVVYWKQYLRDNWGFGLSLTGPVDNLPFGIGHVHLLLVAASVIIASRSRTVRMPMLTFTAVMLFILLLMSNWCTWLWRLPLARTIQFPWRMFSVAAIASAVAGAFTIEALPRRWRIPVAAACCMLLVAWSAPRISVSGYFPMPSSTYSAANTRLHDTMTNVGEFLPTWARPEQLTKPSDKLVVTATGQRLALLAGEDSTHVAFSATSPDETTATAHVFYFPGWQTYRDGLRIPTGPGPSGLVAFPLARGRADYVLKWGPSPTRWYANLVSITTLLGGLVALLVMYRSRRVVKPVR
jgi:hypothetical protein